jgi:hypothetical protein
VLAHTPFMILLLLRLYDSCIFFINDEDFGFLHFLKSAARSSEKIGIGACPAGWRQYAPSLLPLLQREI